LRRPVLEPGSGEIRTIFRRERRIRIRRAAGWHLDWATKIAAACSDVLALLYTLMEFSTPNDMLLWALQRAADAE
jgi:hypothetical protein